MIPLSEIWQAIEAKVVGLIHRTEARGCRVIRTSGQSVANNAWVALSFDSEINDTDGCWDVGSPTRLTAQRDGYYAAGGSVTFPETEITAASRLVMSARVNGSTYVGQNENHTIANQSAGVGVTAGMFWMSAGDYVEICVYHNQGAAKTTTPATQAYQHFCNGWLMRVG